MNVTIDPVRAFYAALGRGDVPAVLALLHDDIAWTEAEGFPYFSGTWRKPEDIVNKLIMPLMRDWDDFAAEAREFIAEGERVVSLGAYRGVSKSTGKAMRAPFAHVWRVTGGKIKSFDMYTDTLLVARAMQP
jgi:ketosteroid isomerase-like protein